MILVTFTRDSVCQADDVDAPHEYRLSCSKDETTNHVLDMLIQRSPLPCIFGGKATWVIGIDRAVAVLAQEWPFIRWLPGAPALLTDVCDSASQVSMHACYAAQADPEQVYDRMLKFPERWKDEWFVRTGKER